MDPDCIPQRRAVSGANRCSVTRPEGARLLKELAWATDTVQTACLASCQPEASPDGCRQAGSSQDT